MGRTVRLPAFASQHVATECAWRARKGSHRVRGGNLTGEDPQWLAGAEPAAASTTSAPDEATIRFAIGKYFDKPKRDRAWGTAA
jgi:hypothetical protein